MDQVPPHDHGGDTVGASGVPHNELSGIVDGPVVQAGRIDSVHIHAGRVAVVPQALPRDVREFVDRADEMAQLDEWVAAAHAQGQPALALVTGVGGVGKTCTAVHWAHSAKSRFAGGQLYANLGGSAPTGPVHPHEVLGHFLRLLGCADVPASEDARGSMFRSLVANLDILIVLDDAATATQVRGLLPAGPRAAVVVTSRSRLDDLLLEEFQLLRLDVFDLAAAVELVVRTIDSARAAAEPDALRALALLCDRLPLALRIAAGQLLTRYRGPVSRYVQRLSDGRELLAALAVGDDRLIDAVFDDSYRALDEENARAYRLLALWPGPEFGIPAAAALLDRSEDTTEILLESLVAANLVNAPRDGRYDYHSLVRRHAHRHAEQTEPAADRRAAIGRTVDWYLRFAVARDRLLSDRPRINRGLYELMATEPAPGNREQALVDMDAEKANLFAAVLAADQYELGDRPWQLCETLFILYQTYDYYQDWLDTHRLGVHAATRVGDRRAEMRMLSQLGSAYFAVRDYTQALHSFAESGRVAAEIGDDLGQQSAWEWRAFVHEGLGDYSAMLDCLLRSREFVLRLPDSQRPRALALSDMHIGRALKNLGRFDEAMHHVRDAEAYFSAYPTESTNTAKTLTTLGQAILGEGRAAEALPVLRRALEMYGEREALSWQAELLASIGTALQQLGDAVAAQEYLTRAGAMDAALGDRRAEALRPRPGIGGPVTGSAGS